MPPLVLEKINVSRNISPWQWLEDRLLYNDRYIHRFTATASNLEPGKNYKFKIGSIEEYLWSETGTFKTAPKSPAPFSFIYFGDTHYTNYWGKPVNIAHDNHPEAAFYTIAGTIVSTGLYRNEWDQLFDISADVFDEHHVDMVMSGHVHYYMRSKPMYAGTPVASPADGTIYFISISIPNRNREMPPRDWVDVRFGGEGLYQTFDIDNKKLVYRSLNIKGEVKDGLVIQK